ncbi:unnamed protein product [Citrullus colocynthis]|uniref:Uncharacterized protein n=1 Tax=Citrullus colocynthis TaxID=252529 RepID=A0ABP0YDN0_9ROSI
MGIVNSHFFALPFPSIFFAIYSLDSPLPRFKKKIGKKKGVGSGFLFEEEDNDEGNVECSSFKEGGHEEGIDRTEGKGERERDEGENVRA